MRIISKLVQSRRTISGHLHKAIGVLCACLALQGCITPGNEDQSSMEKNCTRYEKYTTPWPKTRGEQTVGDAQANYPYPSHEKIKQKK